MRCKRVIVYREVGHEAAKKEVSGYFQSRGEAYPSDASEDLELDYDLVCEIADELKRERRLEVI